MAQPDLPRLIQDAPQALRDVLDDARSSVQPSIRSEIFGVQRFAQQRCTLGDSHRAARATSQAAIFFPRRLSEPLKQIEQLVIQHAKHQCRHA